MSNFIGTCLHYYNSNGQREQNFIMDVKYTHVISITEQ